MFSLVVEPDAGRVDRQRRSLYAAGVATRQVADEVHIDRRRCCRRGRLHNHDIVAARDWLRHAKRNGARRNIEWHDHERNYVGKRSRTIRILHLDGERPCRLHASDGFSTVTQLVTAEHVVPRTTPLIRITDAELPLPATKFTP